MILFFMMRYFFTLLLVLPLWANTLTGKVVKVIDGDTIHILLVSQNIEKIRLAGIDSPERKQAHGQKAKKHLISLVASKTVKISYSKRDRYGRIVGKILLKGSDINLKMVQAGYAWHYKKYQREQVPDDRLSYAVAENNARKHNLGLFQNKAIPPWKWRKNKKNQRKLKPQKKPQVQTFFSKVTTSNIKVWVNLNSGKYHCPNTRYYENTKKGVMMTESKALRAGYHGGHGLSCN